MPQIPDEVRQQVIDWPADAPKGSVAAFCAKHGVSRAWFYKTRRLAAEQGQDAMVKASTRPKTSPARLSELTRMLALAERARLKPDGKDYGPESVRYTLWAKGVDPVPSRSSLVRIFDRAGVVDRNRKKPRSAASSGSPPRFRTSDGSPMGSSRPWPMAPKSPSSRSSMTPPATASASQWPPKRPLKQS